MNNLQNQAILSNKNDFSSFSYKNNIIRFKTSPKLERYTKILDWDNGYICVMAKYKGMEEVEEYIDLVPILENLYFSPNEFLKPIKSVRIEYD